MAKLPDFRDYASLVDMFDDHARRSPDRTMFIVERPDGDVRWTPRDLIRRSRLAAWRMTAAGLAAGDRLLIWAPTGPEMATLYIAAWRARIVPVPLDLHMPADLVARIAERADTRWIATGVGPEPAGDGSVMAHLERLPVEHLVRERADDVPADYGAQIDRWPRPQRGDMASIMFTSGTTGTPRGVMHHHGVALEPLDVLSKDVRTRLLMRLLLPSDSVSISVMPMSHVMGVGDLILSAMIGATVVYPAARSPRALLETMRRHRPTSISVAPRFLELLWAQLVREIKAGGGLESFERRRARARRMPYSVRRRMFRDELALIGGRMRQLGSAAAYLPPDVQAAWESIGIPVTQGYGATECGVIAGTNKFRHPLGKVGQKARSATVELAPDGEILVSGPGVSRGYWRDPEATSKSFDELGRYHTGDVGQFDSKGNLVLIGRKRNVIVLPNGLNVFPEDIETQLHLAGLGETVVLETAPGRIEAVVLRPEEAIMAALTERVEEQLRLANSRLSIHQRVDSWRIWPEDDFPRTHTLKIRRDPVRAWATNATTVGLQVFEGQPSEA